MSSLGLIYHAGHHNDGHTKQEWKQHVGMVWGRKGGFVESKVNAIVEEIQGGRNHILQIDGHGQAQFHPLAAYTLCVWDVRILKIHFEMTITSICDTLTSSVTQ